MPYPEAVSPAAPAIILARPQLGENIGAAARAMANFGLSDLRLVSPRDGWPSEKAARTAMDGRPIIENAKLFATLPEALGDLNLVLATSARNRGTTKEILTPQEGAGRLRTGPGRTGILFGNERTGLENDELSYCDAVITIPTAEFSSLNLGQAVLLLSYEWFRRDDMTPATQLDHGPLARPASRKELFDLFAHLEDELLKAQFLFPPNKRLPMIRAMRATLHRAALTDQEVRTIRGMIVALVRNKYRGGKPE